MFPFIWSPGPSIFCFSVRLYISIRLSDILLRGPGMSRYKYSMSAPYNRNKNEICTFGAFMLSFAFHFAFQKVYFINVFSGSSFLKRPFLLKSAKRNVHCSVFKLRKVSAFCVKYLVKTFTEHQAFHCSPDFFST